MIKGIAIKNGKTKLILIGEDDIDKAFLKALDGATCRIIKDNLRVHEQNVSDGLILEIDLTPTKEA